MRFCNLQGHRIKMKVINFLFVCGIISLVILESCAPKVTTSTTQTTSKYSEDLSVYRPKVEETVDTASTPTNNTTVDNTKRNPSIYVEARHAINEPLETVLDSIDRINLSNGLIDGFTIQLYSGLKREEALNIKKELTFVLPKIDAEVQYVQPNFRVRAGKYINRTDAQKDYMTIKRHFPSAIVIPDRIPIREIQSQR
jgi:hypothetical protein